MVKEGIKSIKPTLEILCLKGNTITNNPSCDPSPSSIPVEVETISEPTVEPPQEPETNSKPSAPSSSSPVPEASNPILDGSDEEEEHYEAQTQALRNYQLARDRVRRVPKDHPRLDLLQNVFSQIESIDFNEMFSPINRLSLFSSWAALWAVYLLAVSGPPLNRVFYLLAASGLPLDRVTRDVRGLGWPPESSAGDPRDRSAFSSY
ncbi:hypothetical protein M9H77_25644 [Catharanthus roseus]|uniref:Uncharacterized protein n=1 Tax=Catharanthus roseus TaxID=4058 RepID=A0ACC0ABH7_CATRO|nr:hypothetical protein M9H77_25644 [Catharanthus roseus]